MKLPRSVTVGHLKLRFRELPQTEAVERGIDGWFDYENGRIEVAESLTPSVKAEITLHEILHAAFYVAKTGASDDEEEKVVSALAPVLLSVIRDNPSLISTLRKAAKQLSKET